ncbi:uncharacterized protein LOC124160227 [Ischnura elegans]|uniref:uncharacterized protein LOC124160227 n=1 Tax=Ischnura elegans TaxID=197161 RepID=UPI001ED8BBF1|nr:uncharacterized protein LOC124160227 [Ischnura elegans]
MSRFWATCFGGSEEQSSPRRRRRPGRNDSDTDSSYDTDNEESDYEDGMKKFGLGDRRHIGPGKFHREEDIRLEDVVTSEDFRRDGTIRGRGEISVLDVPNTRVPPAVTQFVELVLKESQRGPPEQPIPFMRTDGTTGATSRLPYHTDTVLPQVSLLREASRRQQVLVPLPDASSDFVISGKGEERKRVNSGGSISSSGSSDGESEGTSSTSSGIGDSFASGNDTGGSGGGRLDGAGMKAFQIGNGNRSKPNATRRSKNHWSHDALQDVVVEDVEVSHGNQVRLPSRERIGRHPLNIAEGVHLPNHHRDWGARRLYDTELPIRNPSQIGNNRYTRY